MEFNPTGDLTSVLSVIDGERPGIRNGKTLLVLGWSRLAAQAREGSGLNLSASELCAALVERGWRVVYLQSGMDYSLRPGMWISLKEIWRGVGCFSLFNSPNLAPGNFNFRNITHQIEHAAQMELVSSFVRALSPDAVHVQALEGFPLSCLRVMKEVVSGPVVLTPHNYYYLCPQVDLLAAEREICEDFAGGLRCASCLHHAPDPKDYIAWRRRYQTAERLAGTHALLEVKNRLAALKHGFSRLLSAGVPVFEPLKTAHNSAHSPDNGVRTHPLPQLLPPRPTDQNQRLLAGASRSGQESVNEHGRRRRVAVEALNITDGLLCPSQFLASVYAAFGVEKRLLHHVPLGQPHFDILHRVARSSADYSLPAWNPSSTAPLRLAYFGNCYPNKGLATLCAALNHLDPTALGKVHVTIRASGDDAPFRAMVQHNKSLQGRILFCGGYDIPTLISASNTYDLCLFPNTGLENSPFVVLEALHAGRPVIASNLGGPTDFIHHERNGLLVPGADPVAIADAITRVLAGGWQLPSREAVHAASNLVGFESYVSNMERYLAGAFSDRA
jgi:glycosyltransferase involved in cell wall biosynthesis